MSFAPENTILINLRTLSGSEVPLRSVRRTRIELRLIRNIAQMRYAQNGDTVWAVGSSLIAYEPGNDLLALIELDQNAHPDQSKIIVLDDWMILRSEAMSENQILKTISRVAYNKYNKEDWLASDQEYFVMWISM